MMRMTAGNTAVRNGADTGEGAQGDLELELPLLAALLERRHCVVR